MVCSKTVTKSGTPIKLLIGGSPCTKWSIAQKNGREVLPEDRGILLRDVLETGWTTDRDKSRTILSSIGQTTTREYFGHSQNTMVYYQLESVVPINTTADGKARTVKAQYHHSSMANFVTNGGYPATAVATPIRIGTIESNVENKSHDSKQYRVYSPDGKATTLCGQGGGVGAKTGLYAVPVGGKGKDLPVYEVRDGLITIKDKQYPIKLADGYYLIRKLTPLEGERLQTLPDGYTSGVSDTQRYRAIGNGWTAEVIIHILNHALKDIPRDEELVVLSMYDGIATGRYCLDKMGFTNVRYYAYEIDPYAIKIAMSNYPDIVQCGDAFQIRNF